MATLLEYLEARQARFEGLADKANPKTEPIYRAYAREVANTIAALKICTWDDYKQFCPVCKVDLRAWQETFREPHNCTHPKKILDASEVVGILPERKED